MPAARRCGAGPSSGRRPGAARDLLADMLHRAWSALIEPWWPRLRDVLDADITFRARRLANAGVAAALDGLHPKVSWRDGAVRFAAAGHAGDRPLRDRARPHPQRVCLAGRRGELRPAGRDLPGTRHPRDLAAGAASGEDLARLIGRTRAALLRALADAILNNRAGRPYRDTSQQRERAPSRPARERAAVHDPHRPLPRPSPHRPRPGGGRRLATCETPSKRRVPGRGHRRIERREGPTDRTQSRPGNRP